MFKTSCLVFSAQLTTMSCYTEAFQPSLLLSKSCSLTQALLDTIPISFSLSLILVTCYIFFRFCHRSSLLKSLSVHLFFTSWSQSPLVCSCTSHRYPQSMCVRVCERLPAGRASFLTLNHANI